MRHEADAAQQQQLSQQPSGEPQPKRTRLHVRLAAHLVVRHQVKIISQPARAAQPRHGFPPAI
jgi:hypothetical protein